MTRTVRMPLFFRKRQVWGPFKPKMLSICKFYFQEAPFPPPTGSAAAETAAAPISTSTRSINSINFICTSLGSLPAPPGHSIQNARTCFLFSWNTLTPSLGRPGSWQDNNLREENSSPCLLIFSAHQIRKGITSPSDRLPQECHAINPRPPTAGVGKWRRMFQAP